MKWEQEDNIEDKLVPTEYDVKYLVYSVKNIIELKAEEKGLKLLVDINPMTPTKLYGDDIRIRQVIVNLLNNAVKYTEKGSVKLRIDSENCGDYSTLTIRVEDTGIGIKEEDMEDLFEKFKRVDEQRNRSVEGTGLGMNIALSLLQLMDSELNCAK